MGTTPLSFGPDHPIDPIEPTTQNESLVIGLDTYVKLLDRLDGFSHLTEENPYKHCFEYHDPYIIEWKEWKRPDLKDKWEKILDVNI